MSDIKRPGHHAEYSFNPETRLVFILVLGKHLFGPFDPGPSDLDEYKRWKQEQELELCEYLV